ncbi:MAG: HD domain-containing protein [archaeon]|nr:HD domain-containing protein [archaeon]
MESKNTNSVKNNFESMLSLNQLRKYPNVINKLEPYRTVFDPIHGHIRFPKIMWDIIDTPQFQRLRNLQQLTATSLLFLGGTHTRFEHCLGTGYLANDLIQKCLNILNVGLIDHTELIKNVSIAGLCHDIAHGPFSHYFNDALRKLNIGQNWDHEEFGEKIINYMVDENQIDLNSEQLKIICSLIKGEKRKDIKTEYPWIYQIVANKENSIDVDKFDYISRDIYNLGLHVVSPDYERIFGNCNRAS